MTMTKKTRKRYYTVDEANATLPLVRSIVRDITELASSLQERHERLERLQKLVSSPGHQEEIDHIVDEFEREQERMKDFEQELRNLQVELKDYFVGLIDFPCWMNDHEVYLCWKLGEPEVGHWHEIDAGFTGRQRLR